MVTGDIEIHINSKTTYQTSPFPSRINSVFINLFHKLRSFSVNETDGTLTFTGFHPTPPLSVPQIHLNLFSYEFSPNYLFSVIDSHLNDLYLSHHIANTIAAKVIQQHNCFQQPFIMSVNVILIQDLLFSIQEEDKEEELKPQCAICFEDLPNYGTMILPQCSHQFHFGCIGEWLQGNNSCPLCREIVFES